MHYILNCKNNSSFLFSESILYKSTSANIDQNTFFEHYFICDLIASRLTRLKHSNDCVTRFF